MYHSSTKSMKSCSYQVRNYKLVKMLDKVASWRIKLTKQSKVTG